jgi:rfaE bifunctional protein kinase chain/domain
VERGCEKGLSDKLQSLLLEIKKARVIVIGDVMLDRYIYGVSERLSPEAPVPIVRVVETREMPGGAGNAAMNIYSIGAIPYLIGVIGSDEEGKRLKELIQERMGGFLVKEKRQTTTKTRVISHSQHIVRFDREETHQIEKITELEIIERLKDLKKKFKTVLISDYGKGVITKNILYFIKKEFSKIIVDPFSKNFSLYKGVYLLLPNAKEAEEISGVSTADEEGCERAGRILLRKGSANWVLIKRGDKGMVLIGKKKREKIPAVLREVYDVAGAGDTVAGIISAGIDVGGDVKTCAYLASIGASIVVGKTGTATPTQSEMVEELEIAFQKKLFKE